MISNEEVSNFYVVYSGGIGNHDNKVECMSWTVSGIISVLGKAKTVENTKESGCLGIVNGNIEI